LELDNLPLTESANLSASLFDSFPISRCWETPDGRRPIQLNVCPERNISGLQDARGLAGSIEQRGPASGAVCGPGARYRDGVGGGARSQAKSAPDHQLSGRVAGGGELHRRPLGAPNFATVGIVRSSAQR
jgi:hypothetical protein